MGLVDQLDGRADLFSVGAMMHALMSGHRINNGRTEQEALVMATVYKMPTVLSPKSFEDPSLVFYFANQKIGRAAAAPAP